MNEPPHPSSVLLQGTIAFAPFVGIGTAVLLGAPSVGVGLQPAYLLGAAVLGALVLERRGLPAPSRAVTWVIGAWLWTAVGVVAAWRLDHLGLAGEVPWAKMTKQLAMLAFLAALAVAPAWRLARAPHPWRELRRWERASTLGLLVASVVGLVQVVGFYAPSATFESFQRIVTSNPSIASGSHELYLGHRFVGIPRVAGPACEPLYFGSYLLVAVPVAVLGTVLHRGLARAWRAAAVTLGAACFVLGFSRGAYFGAGVLVLLLLVAAGRSLVLGPNRRRVALAAGSAIVVVSVLAAAGSGLAPWQVPELVVDRLAQSFRGHDMSNLTRVYAWRASVDAFVTQPWLGVGWGGFGFLYYTLAGDAGAGAHFGWPVTNSVPLRFLAETGAVGVVLWTIAMGPAIAGLRRFRTGASSPGDGLALLMAAIVVALLAQGLTFSQLQLPHLWLTFGIAAATHLQRHRLV